MLHALVDLDRRLREQGELPPSGYSVYSAPILWRVQVWPGEPGRTAVGEDESDAPLPASGRTVNIRPYPLGDTGAYVLGRETKADGKPDRNAEKKHAAFRDLLADLLGAEEVQSEPLRDAIQTLLDGLDAAQAHPLAERVEADAWLQVVPEAGPLAGQPLHLHDEVQAWWRRQLAEAVMGGGGHRGACAVTGEDGLLVSRIPGKGYLRGKDVKIQSLNQDAYVSFVGGTGAKDRTHIGLSFEAADAANRTLGYLARHERHHKTVVYDKSSGLATLTAVYWLAERDATAPEAVEIGGEHFDPQKALDFLTAPIDVLRGSDKAPEADLAQLDALLSVPYSSNEARLRLDERAFQLALVSMVEVRLVLRDWLSVGVGTLLDRLRRYLDAAKLVTFYGDEVRAPTHREILSHLGARDPNLGRALLYAAYAGRPISEAVLRPALARLKRTTLGGGDDRARPYREHALLALVKLVLTQGDSDAAIRLQHLDPMRNQQAYQCGRLLAVLEYIQAQSHRAGTNNPKARLNTTLTAKYYGAASAAPGTVFGVLLRTANASHLRKLEGNEKWRGSYVNLSKSLGEVLGAVEDAGGFPTSLSLRDQAEFALGFYAQRAHHYGGSADGTSDNDSDASPDSDA